MKLNPILNKEFTISQKFGENSNIYNRFNLAGHNGIDFATPENSALFSPIDGIIYVADYNPTGYGKYLKLRNENYEIVLGHLASFLVQEGQEIKTGDLIGFTGNTGFSTGPHLHLGVRELKSGTVQDYYNGYFGYKDPENYFDNFFNLELIKEIEEIEIVNTGADFDNVPDWAKEAYEFVIEEGISNGERPDSEISREEFWVMLLRFSEVIGEDWQMNEDFAIEVNNLDIANRPSEWAEEAYLFVTTEKISNGERPKEYIKREELWTVIKRFCEDYEEFKKNTNTDKVEGVSDWALESYYFATTNGISDGTKPQNYVSRAEVWTMLLRCVEILEK